ncbi:hypothetical protein RJ55_02502 [Drechmeria coniospora]|nr:hypothetical protein RJ55_02502 [Drechmeria coniospora]
MTTVLVGARQLNFTVNRRLLRSVSSFFRERLDDPSAPTPVCLWLPGESGTMFALFVEWVHWPSTFRHFVDQAVSDAHETSASQDLHWAIIHLHLFAANLKISKLQDLAMDAIQDLYLKYDWDVPPNLIKHLYAQSDAVTAVRIRRWAVAMVAFSLTTDPHQPLKFHPQDSATSDLARFRALFDSLPEFAADYAMHVRNMTSAGIDVRFKNPQLRISANKLRNDQRMFGFRECSFHSHRSSVGEGQCPHSDNRHRRRPLRIPVPELDLTIGELELSRRDSLPSPIPPPLFSTHPAGAPAKHTPILSIPLTC